MHSHKREKAGGENATSPDPLRVGKLAESKII